MSTSATAVARMRDDASLERLVEMGFSVYVPRAATAASGAAPITDSAARSTTQSSDGGHRAHVVLLAHTDAAGVRALLEGVQRALAFARIDAIVASAVDKLGDAAGLVVFGDALAREAGVALPAARQNALQWVTADDAARIAGNPKAKRALWSELRRISRTMRAAKA